MGTFVHLTSEKNLPGIRRSGIKPETIHYEEVIKGVFCMPVSDDFFATHQWARELMRFGLRNPQGVYFRIPDDQEVLFGRYNEKHRKGTAAEAAAAFQKREDKMGFQVIVPRKIAVEEIKRYRSVPPLGWRFYPAAKGRKLCFCPACISRAEYGSHKLLMGELDKRYAHYRSAMHSGDKKDIIFALRNLDMLISDQRLPFPRWPELLGEHLFDEELLLETARVLSSLHSRPPMEALLPYVQQASPHTQGGYAQIVLYALGLDGKSLLESFADVPEVISEISEYGEWAGN